MKKLLALLVVWNLSLSGITVFLYATQPEPINRTVTYQVNKVGENGYTPIKGVDYFDGKTLPAIQPKDPAEPREPMLPKDPTNGKDGDSAYQIAQRHGFLGSEEEWLYSLKPQSIVFEPEIDCDSYTGKFKWRSSPENSFQFINNSKCIV